MSEWISVKDRLPDKNGLYLVYDDENVYIAEFVRGREWTDPIDGYCEFPVTHWMPLPEPPEEGE